MSDLENQLEALRRELSKANGVVKETRKALSAAIYAWTQSGRTPESVARDHIRSAHDVRRQMKAGTYVTPTPPRVADSVPDRIAAYCAGAQTSRLPLDVHGNKLVAPHGFRRKGRTLRLRSER